MYPIQTQTTFKQNQFTSMFDSTVRGTKIDSRDVELILTCWVTFE